MEASATPHPLWQGRDSGHLAAITEALNHSLRFDKRLARHDMQGSRAHAAMLGKQGILSAEEAQALIAELDELLKELEAGQLDFEAAIASGTEDIHSFVEQELTRRLGDTGKKLHTGRSRNDQVCLDMRLFLREALDEQGQLITSLLKALEDQASQHEATLMPGYTHLQQAQPITFALHLRAYVAMLERDRARLQDARERLNHSPLGAGALAGSTFALDRAYVAETLGMEGVLRNPLDAVGSRDFVLETLAALAILMSNLSRLAEECILWSSSEFNFIRLDTAFTTGSSMMPQKRNPDLAELVRGKTGRVYGQLMTMLTTVKALPLAYNKDLQEDKEALFDALDTVTLCLTAFTGMISSLTVNKESMRQAMRGSYLNATDLADYLVRKGLPFREAYRLVGEAVSLCEKHHCALDTLALEDYQSLSPLFSEDLYAAITLEACVAARRNNL